jgi:hypothetical protein
MKISDLLRRSVLDAPIWDGVNILVEASDEVGRMLDAEGFVEKSGGYWIEPGCFWVYIPGSHHGSNVRIFCQNLEVADVDLCRSAHERLAFFRGPSPS